MRWRVALILAALAGGAIASEGEKPVERNWVRAPDAPRSQTAEQAAGKTRGCMSCHTATDEWTMHKSGAVVLGCTDCHGGDATVVAAKGLGKKDSAYVAARDKAHVLPRYPGAWHFPHTANPKQSYTLLNKEAPEFIRFVNPSDYRVVRESCGACHMDTIVAAERSLMSTGAMFFGGASYNNGILPFKNYAIGEAYTREGEPARLQSAGIEPGLLTEDEKKRGAIGTLYPLPKWQVLAPGDIFRVFERGGRNIVTQFPEIGLPNANGALQRLEEPGRPDIRQSNRGPGTGLRISVPVINIHKTRLNDPFTWFMGTNDQPGDYRTSGCAACHVVYANDREPRHSGPWSTFGRDGKSFSSDPTIPKDEPGHPIKHMFTRAIPTAQCMNCHMHQPNMFVNSYLGYTMWDYESDAPAMWPEKQKYPTAKEQREVLDRNPEGAAPRGKWADIDFLRTVNDRNPSLKDTQFADYHGHGWNFRAVLKRDRDGNLLDQDGAIVANDDPEKWRRKGEGQFVPPGTNPGKTVHMMDIHAEKGMQCVDCHFAQDGHGNGLIHGEVANAVEIGCKDCHGTAKTYPTLRTSNLAASPEGNDLTLIRNPDGRRRFEWVEQDGRRALLQRSVDGTQEWRIHLTKDSVTRGHPDFNPKAARAKLMGRPGPDGKLNFGPGVGDLAHKDEEIACYSCHLSWTTSCGGCHLPIEANWKTTSHKYDGEETRNYATYNPQVARDDMFQLGKHQTTKGNIVAPIRSSSALILSSTNINRERIYVQQPPISASGYSSQAFGAHFPHTVRTTETKTCSDCHLSDADDNNAIMAQLVLNGTNFVNFVGMHAFVGLGAGLEAVRVTEWDEPQAVFGSYLQRYAYPDYWKAHVERNGRELIDWNRGLIVDSKSKYRGETRAMEEIRNVTQRTGGAVKCLQLRGEYLYVAEGKGGFTAYDVANIGNKGISEKIVASPFSRLGHRTHIDTPDATCMALPTNQSISVKRNEDMLAGEKANPDTPSNQEQPFHPIYRYAVITDAVDGLILVDIDTLTDREPRNNFFKRAVTWNEGGVLTGARFVTLAGHFAYIATPRGVVVVDLNVPTRPRLAANVPMADPRGIAVQFRYAFVTTARGLETLDITRLGSPVVVGTVLPIKDARRVYVARTFAYIAAKAEGLVIADVKNPLKPRSYGAYTFDGKLNDAEDVIVGSTNASLFAYVADGRNGMKVLQLTSPSSQPNFYGFSPPPVPELIAWARTASPALALSKGLDRDRGVDESGHQMAVFGRLGSRPFTRAEMERLFLDARGVPWKVADSVDMKDWSPLRR
ncbi:LVIVD repeat-containing protein [Glacieibacterium frigidum]|uniref:Uncharacterized protein n=1 Tax=Glacieibacterium frigidum TaxID=2593303 RepID=A0A552U9F9_9SPHN|nr:hypothetical protein [Glacieibacterium frigidum]TRW14852.1 hypothetical protein FMM06_14350 [Glacieibacterium frigidum]